MQIRIQHNFPEVARWIDRVGKQAKFAAAVALTKTAQEVRTELREEMRRVFHRPTSFTLNSLYLSMARPTNLTATVWLKDSNGPHYLLPNIDGGERPVKRFERLLIAAGYMKAGERAVPGAGARLDSNGNMNRGQIVQILSQLRAFRSVGGTNQNKSSSRRSVKSRTNNRYFVSLGKGVISRGFGSWFNSGAGKAQHLARGVWVDTGAGIKPVLLFVGRATYSRRFPFYKVAERVINARFPRHFEAEFAKALRTAR